MTAASKLPIVAIIGRANVGKSSLFNVLLARRQTITAAEAGTTRDSITAKLELEDRDFWLVDTAGLKEADDQLELSIQAQISQAAAAADLILVVIEAATLVDEDRRVASIALKTGRAVILVVNKIDRRRNVVPADWARLGIKVIVPVSVSQKRGLDELLGQLKSHLPSVKARPEPQKLRLALLGRPNVGKSSLFNRLAGRQQAIVDERGGTTRDVNEVTFYYQDRQIVLSDTAGIRRSGKIGTGVEQFSVLHSLAALQAADIGLLLIDAAEPVAQQDQKIASLIKTAGRGLILVVSKADLLSKDRHEQASLGARLAEAYRFTPWAPLVFTSAVSGQNVTKLLDLSLEIDKARHQLIPTALLNRWLGQVAEQHPPAGLRGTQPHLNYMIQESLDPLNFKIFGKDSRSLHWSYKRYLERRFREKWPYVGLPLNFWFFNKQVHNTGHGLVSKKAAGH